MSIDLSKLTPGEWVFHDPTIAETMLGYPRGLLPCLLGPGEKIVLLSHQDGIANLQFAAIARKAFAGDPEALAWWEANRKRG